MSSLNQQYEEKVRPCIDLIDSLRSLGVEKDLALPAIAVIGDQSSGKSSVLEALSGVALPRGSGIVTRCPLELKMKKTSKDEGWYGRISYQGKEEDIKIPENVEEMIRQAQDEMAGVGVGISDELISLEISSPDIPDLTLIDLPGIARVAVKGQPEDIGDQIKRLIKKFINKQETINLVVVPCNVDIATTEALKMAQEVDPEGERTLGILTKPDLVDKGTEETVVDIVHNNVIQLTKGYMIVRCRGQKDILDRLTLVEASDKEKAFFQDHTQFSVLYNEGHATIPKLAEKLTLELVHHIERSLPRLKEQIEAKLAETDKDLERCGLGPPAEPREKMTFLIDFFLPVIVNQRIEKEIYNYEEQYRGRELPGFINYKTFEVLIKDQIKKLEEPAIQSVKEISDIIRKAFHQLAQNSFPGFPNLLKASKAKIEAIKMEKEAMAEATLRLQFKMEMLIYTQDSIYSQSLMARKQNEEQEELGPPSYPRVYSLIHSNQATLSEMMLHLKSYYQIANQRLSDQLPLVVRFLLLQEAALQLQREMLQLLQEKDPLEHLLKEDCDTGNKRASLQSRRNRLMEAHNYLVAF
uniref:Interferon-induced GTP-binding protein Mx n=1 Tax=Denticeps clupeoides TaxID=299321 RepID=A0AAY4EQ39_9TELE